MINTKYLATYFTDLLNQYGATYNKSFKIFADSLTFSSINADGNKLLKNNKTLKITINPIKIIIYFNIFFIFSPLELCIFLY